MKIRMGMRKRQGQLRVKSLGDVGVSSWKESVRQRVDEKLSGDGGLWCSKSLKDLGLGDDALQVTPMMALFPTGIFFIIVPCY